MKALSILAVATLCFTRLASRRPIVAGLRIG